MNIDSVLIVLRTKIDVLESIFRRMTASERVLLTLTFSQYVREAGMEPKEDESRFMKPEDIMISKLLWAKKSGSERQIRDVEGVCAEMGAELDWNYLNEWARKLGVEDLLGPLQNARN